MESLKKRRFLSCLSTAQMLGASTLWMLGFACSSESPEASPKAAQSTPQKSQAKPPARKPSRPAPSPAQLLSVAKKYFEPLPSRAESPENPLTDAKIELGRMLFYDPRISKNHDTSCNSCHKLDNFGVDGEVTSKGHKGQRGERNSPTVYNAAIHFKQFWDGRSDTVEEQAKQPILNPVEMGMKDEPSVLAVLRSIPGYVEMFKTVFPDDKEPITYTNLGKAIGAFERGLMTKAPFDEFLAGSLTALDSDALRGLELFIDAQCTNCHIGPALGGTMFQKLGNVKEYPTKDQGRFLITKDPKDKYVFKVPGLRNVVKTGPYLHDGSIATLDQMLDIMAEYQTPKGRLNDEERRYLTAFLASLTGKVDTNYIEVPKLPENGPNTPAPDPS